MSGKSDGARLRGLTKDQILENLLFRGEDLEALSPPLLRSRAAFRTAHSSGRLSAFERTHVRTSGSTRPIRGRGISDASDLAITVSR